VFAPAAWAPCELSQQFIRPTRDGFLGSNVTRSTICVIFRTRKLRSFQKEILHALAGLALVTPNDGEIERLTASWLNAISHGVEPLAGAGDKIACPPER